MIYLIKTEYKSLTLLKIGYTADENWERRLTQYKLHNPLCEVIKTISGGTEEHEHKLHYRFREYLYDGYGREWFKEDEEILSFFGGCTLEELDQLPINPKAELQKNANLLKSWKIYKLLDYVLREEGREDITTDSFKDMLKVVKYSSTTCESIFVDLQSSNNFPSIAFKTWEEVGSGLFPKMSEEVEEFMEKYDQLSTYVDKMKYLCEFATNNPEYVDAIVCNLAESDKIKQHFIGLGSERIKGLGYDVTRINKALGIKVFDQELIDSAILSTISIGDKYTKKDLKEILSKVYEHIGYKATAKASDIEKYFDVSLTKITDATGKKENAFNIKFVKTEFQAQYNLLRVEM